MAPRSGISAPRAKRPKTARLGFAVIADVLDTVFHSLLCGPRATALGNIQMASRHLTTSFAAPRPHRPHQSRCLLRAVTGFPRDRLRGLLPTRGASIRHCVAHAYHHLHRHRGVWGDPARVARVARPGDARGDSRGRRRAAPRRRSRREVVAWPGDAPSVYHRQRAAPAR